VVELGPHPDEGPAPVERLAEDLEQRRALLEHLEEALVALELFAMEVLEQAGRPADIEALLLRGQRLVEERAQDGGERRPRGPNVGSSSRRRSAWLPSSSPATRSFRYCAAQDASPGSTGSAKR
jgi:hypothetical protein